MCPSFDVSVRQQALFQTVQAEDRCYVGRQHVPPIKLRGKAGKQDKIKKIKEKTLSFVKDNKYPHLLSVEGFKVKRTILSLSLALHIPLYTHCKLNFIKYHAHYGVPWLQLAHYTQPNGELPI